MPFGPTPSFSNLRDHGRSYPTDNIAVNFQSSIFLFLPPSSLKVFFFFFCRFFFVLVGALSSQMGGPPNAKGEVEMSDDEMNFITNFGLPLTVITYLLAW